MTDAAARLTPLGVMVLALLREDDMHPYEMIRLLRQRDEDRIVPVAAGTMYHTVSRLEQAGLLAEVGASREGNRPERTTYTVTDAGVAAVQEWVRRELPQLGRPVQFRVALAEAHNIDRDEAIALLTVRRDALASALAAHREGLERTLDGRVPEVYLMERQREAALLDADLTWLSALIERASTPDYGWHVPAHRQSDRYQAQREAARR